MSLDSMGPSQTASARGGTIVGSRMTHSLSTPSGVDGTPSNVSRGGKKLAIRIQMLDDSVTLFQVQVSGMDFFLLFYYILNIFCPILFSFKCCNMLKRTLLNMNVNEL